MSTAGRPPAVLPTWRLVVGRLAEFGLVWTAVWCTRLLVAASRFEGGSTRAGAGIAAHVANRQTLAVVVASVIGLVGHEAGHALAAVAMRARIRGVRIGIGPTVLRIGSLRVRMFPIGGHVLANPGPRGLPVFLLGGVAANAVLAGVSWQVTATGWASEFRWALVLTQVWFVLWNGIPLRAPVTGVPNDALRLRLAGRARRAAERAGSVLRGGAPSEVRGVDTALASRGVEGAFGDAALRRHFLALVDADLQVEARAWFDEHRDRLGADRHLLERLLSDEP